MGRIRLDVAAANGKKKGSKESKKMRCKASEFVILGCQYETAESRTIVPLGRIMQGSPRAGASPPNRFAGQSDIPLELPFPAGAGLAGDDQVEAGDEGDELAS